MGKSRPISIGLGLMTEHLLDRESVVYRHLPLLRAPYEFENVDRRRCVAVEYDSTQITTCFVLVYTERQSVICTFNLVYHNSED
ncbi:hypothetical protein NDU88_005273 [Pleurodeles waltl]|uniref:Uncharacterized protein n=1 Tax=Pleurodeles waltl TaxID=8319 RepID=A0AAV7TC21_PLEWA|nr:hypothetical protein NDU88_005273 [Pleurodeles waltl]